MENEPLNALVLIWLLRSRITERAKRMPYETNTFSISNFGDRHRLGPGSDSARAASRDARNPGPSCHSGKPRFAWHPLRARFARLHWANAFSRAYQWSGRADKYFWRVEFHEFVRNEYKHRRSLSGAQRSSK